MIEDPGFTARGSDGSGARRRTSESSQRQPPQSARRRQPPRGESSDAERVAGTASGGQPVDGDGGLPAPSIGAMILAAIMVTVTAVFALTYDDSSTASATSIPLDAWMPYWTLDEIDDLGESRMDVMREVSPFWYTAASVDSITIDPNADPELTGRFLQLARDSDAAVVPSIVDLLPAGEMAAILADPVTRTRHVQAIVSFAAEGGFDGIDIDYERFAFSDGRDTWETTRLNWVAFIEELGSALGDNGRTLTVSIPPIYDAERTSNSGFWVYDHGAIAEHVDFIRIMAYDFSVDAAGPIAPLDFVRRSIDGSLAAGVPEEKLVLGIPLYGRNWETAVVGDCPDGVELTGTTSVNARTVGDLISRRSATPLFDPATGESSFTYEIEFVDGSARCVQQRTVHYVDEVGARMRVEIARERGIGGVALWAYGFDSPSVWDQLAAVLFDDGGGAPAPTIEQTTPAVCPPATQPAS